MLNKIVLGNFRYLLNDKNIKRNEDLYKFKDKEIENLKKTYINSQLFWFHFCLFLTINIIILFVITRFINFGSFVDNSLLILSIIIPFLLAYLVKKRTLKVIEDELIYRRKRRATNLFINIRAENVQS
uniref:Uncharacterized protein n=1 Tax=Aliarcobacter butzleri TaxID=28197 RepID=W0LVU5_9BACT|nr:hypothetical protein [Aliarcobacter butzleri]AHG28738.1 hypothetical protein [Aliarcobacter butzleri]